MMSVSHWGMFPEPETRTLTADELVRLLLPRASKKLYTYGLISPRVVARALVELGAIRVVE